MTGQEQNKEGDEDNDKAQTFSSLGRRPNLPEGQLLGRNQAHDPRRRKACGPWGPNQGVAGDPGRAAFPELLAVEGKYLPAPASEIS